MKACAQSGGFSNSADHAAASYMVPVAIQGNMIGRADDAGPAGSGHDDTGTMFTLTKTDVHGVAAPMLIRMREGKEGGGKGPLVSNDQSLTLATANDQVLATVGTLACNTGPNGHDAGNFQSNQGVDAGYVQPVGMQVRRLTPRECERLQGFPDDYTLIPLPMKGRQTRQRWSSDGSRYKALGNSWAVPCVRYIAERIKAVM
jgi:DNA (cytosine-5)-methyltransferase 1